MSRHNVPEDDSLWQPHGTAADLSRCRGRCENRLSIISFRIKWYARPIQVAFPLLVRQLDTSHNASVLGDFARGSETKLKQNPSESAPALGSMWFNGKGNPSPHGLWLHDCYWAAWSNMRPKQMATLNDWSILLGVEFVVRGELYRTMNKPRLDVSGARVGLCEREREAVFVPFVVCFLHAVLYREPQQRTYHTQRLSHTHAEHTTAS